MPVWGYEYFWKPRGCTMAKCNSEHVAKAIAAERGQVYGLCVFDGKFYVGTAEQLGKIGCVNVKGGA